MDIYNRLPQEIQYHIDMILIKKYNQEAILPMIINKRRLILKKYIRLRTTYLMNGIYYWLQLPPSNWERYKNKIKYISFFNNALPKLPKLNYYSTLATINNYFQKLETIQEKRTCINLFLDTFTIEDLEDLLNYSIFTYYASFIDGVNKAPLSLSTNSQFYNVYQFDDY